MTALIHADYEEFMAAGGKERPSLDEQRQQVSYYLAAWGFVHMLYSVPEYKELFNGVVEDMAHGTKLEAAWAARFGAVNPEQLEGDFRKHLLRTEGIEAQAWTTKYTPRPRAAPEQVRTLSAAEVHVLWARLLPWTPQHLPVARADGHGARPRRRVAGDRLLERPLSPRRGGRRRRRGRLARALAPRPNDARYLVAMATLYRGLERPPQDRLDDVMHRLAKVAVAPRALDLVAGYDGAVGQIDEGLCFAARATKADPACYRCYSTGAKLLFAKGRTEEAVEAAERAVNLLPDGVRAPQLVADLRAYRAARDQSMREKNAR